MPWKRKRCGSVRRALRDRPALRLLRHLNAVTSLLPRRAALQCAIRRKSIVPKVGLEPTPPLQGPDFGGDPSHRKGLSRHTESRCSTRRARTSFLRRSASEWPRSASGETLRAQRPPRTHPLPKASNCRVARKEGHTGVARSSVIRAVSKPPFSRSDWTTRVAPFFTRCDRPKRIRIPRLRSRPSPAPCPPASGDRVDDIMGNTPERWQGLEQGGR